MKGGAIANVVDPLGMIGSADEWRTYRQCCVLPSRYGWNAHEGAELSEMLCAPLGLIGNANVQIP